MSKVPSESRIPSRRSGLPLPSSGLPRFLGGQRRATSLHEQSVSQQQSQKFPASNSWFDNEDLQRHLSNLPHPPAAVPLAGSFYDSSRGKHSPATPGCTDIQLTKFRKDGVAAEENCWRNIDRQTSPSDGLSISSRDWSGSRSSSQQCSFSDQLKMIVQDDTYDHYEMPRHAWNEPSLEIDESCVGKKVLISGTQVGYLRYFGETHFGEGNFCGVELKDKVGRHNGTIEGKTYFRCPQGHGIFAPLSKVSLADPVLRENPAVNRRSDPTCSSSASKPNVFSVRSNNRFSDCTDDRISSNCNSDRLSCETVFDSLSYSSAYDSYSKKPCVDSVRNSKHIRKRLSYLDSRGSAGSSIISPDDVTYDESSLGILTPNQMPDFANSSVQPSPSDDVVDLPMDACHEHEPLDHDLVDDEDQFLFEEDISMVIQEIHKVSSEQQSSSEASSPQVQALTPDDEQYSPESIKSDFITPRTARPVSHFEPTQEESSCTSSVANNRLSCPSSSKSVSFIDQHETEFIFNTNQDGTSIGKSCAPDENDGLSAARKRDDNSAIDTIHETSEEHFITGSESGAIPKHRSEHHQVEFSKGKSDRVLAVPDSSQGNNSSRQVLPATARFLHASRGGNRNIDSSRFSEHSSDDRQSEGSCYQSSMTLSSASIDPGYQGDGEFDVPSEVGSVSAGTPTQDPQESHIHEEVADVAQLPVDASSGVATEADISLGDEEHAAVVEEEEEDDEEPESESSFIANRTARVIDGKLYHSHRELMLRGQEGHARGAADQHASEMDSSGFYSDLDPRDEDNTRHDAPPLQPLKESHQDFDVQEVPSSSNEVPVEEKRRSVSRAVQVDASTDLQQIEEEDKSTTSTLRPESKELNSSDRLGSSPAPSETTVKQNTQRCDSNQDVSNCDENSKATTDTNPEKPRNYDKPWLSKPVIRKPETPKKIVVPPPPPRPKKNVESKLKAMLAAQPEPSAEERRARQQQPKRNKWDDVMNKIAEGKEQEKERPKKKEVKSRLMESLKAPQPMSPQAERIRQERKERRERRERQQLAAAAARRNAVRAERKRSSTSVRGSNRTSRAPSLDSLPRDISRPGTPDSSRDASLASHRSCSSVSGSVKAAAPAPSSTAASSVVTKAAPRTARTGANNPATGRTAEGASKVNTAGGSRRLPIRSTEPIKTARSSAASKTGPAAVDAAELKKLEASLSAKTSEAEELKKEAQEVRCDLTKAERGVEALTVIVHHLTQQYDAFSTPALKSELNKTKDCLQSTKIILDESQSALQAAERKLREQEERAAAQREQLTAQHSSALEQLTQQHELELQQLTARHKDELAALGEEHEGVLRRELEKHKQELETTIEEHDKKYQCLVQQLHPHAESPQSCIDPQQVLELKASHASREQELESHSAALLKEQEKLKEHSKKLQESLLSDNDHRLVAIKKYCTGLQHEVDSLKSVVEMRNSELHKLRAQVTAMEQLEKDLEAIRERNRSLVAKTEDLNAQMDAKAKAERQLMTSNRELMESMSRESSMNKQLKLEKEELEWKLQQREALSASLPPMSTLDLMTRATSAATAGSSPLDGSSANSGPRRRSQSRDTSEEPSEVNSSKASSRGADKKFITSTPLPHPHVASSKDQKNGTMSSNNYKNSACEDSSRDTCRKLELTVETNNSPPSSPSMKGVVAKSNSVSFILDLNGSLPEDSFLEFPPSPRLRPHGTPTFNRKPVQKSRSSSLEKSADQSKGVISKCSSAGNFLNKNHIPNVLHSKDKHIKSSGLDNCPERGSHSRNVSESSGGSDSMDSSVDRVSPSGLSWTVPVTSTTRDQYIDLSLRHLHAPEVDEYNSDDSDTDGMQPDITPLVNMINSSSPSDSELSRCGSQAGMVSGTEDEDSITDGEPLVKSPSPIPKPIWVPQVGAGEAMISTDLVSANCKSNNGAAINGDGKQWDPELVGSPPVLSDSDDTPQG